MLFIVHACGFIADNKIGYLIIRVLGYISYY